MNCIVSFAKLIYQ